MANSFLSRYTGAEIDKILASVAGKISLDDIVADGLGGGADKVASADSVKYLYDWKLKFDDPEWLKTLFETIDGSVIFSEDDKIALDKLKRGFVGTFQDTTERSSNVPSAGLKGNEVSLLKNKGGVQSLEYYDGVLKQWIPCKWTKDAKQADIAELTGGNKMVYSFNRFEYNTVKLLIRAETSNDICNVEFTGCVKGANTYWTTQGYIGNNFDLVKVNRMYVEGDTVKVEVTIGSGTTITVYKLAEM
ncbi:hypothetical protein SHAb15599_00073 [Acinetobacter phage SH-Ab 15599]|nr:hypothetical protein SHAb15599_00073 [Acinetobacter phage SH-Ab 15599]